MKKCLRASIEKKKCNLIDVKMREQNLSITSKENTKKLSSGFGVGISLGLHSVGFGGRTGSRG